MIASQKERKIMLKFFRLNVEKEKKNKPKAAAAALSTAHCSGRRRKAKKKNDKQNKKREKSGQFTLHSGTGIRIRCIDEIYFTNRAEEEKKTHIEATKRNNVKSTRETTAMCRMKKQIHCHLCSSCA